MNGARLIYTGRVMQTRKDISIYMDVLSGVNVNKHYLWWNQMLNEF